MKKKSIEVISTRYACATCETIYDDETKADACCVCECGRAIVATDRRYSGTCVRCVTKEAIRRTQERQRKIADEMESNARHLDRLQKEKEAIDDADKAARKAAKAANR